MIYSGKVMMHSVYITFRIGSKRRGKGVSALLLSLFLMPLLAARNQQRGIVASPRTQMPEFMKAYRVRSDEGTVARAVMKNGLTVIVEEHPAQPVACVGTFVRVGYFDEDDDVVGISHVMEHMFFKGTAKRGVGQIARDTRTLGGVL